MPSLPRNLLTVYTANGLNGLLAVFSIPLTVKLLGVSGYGLFSIYTVLVSYILLADFGVSKNLLRLLSEKGSTEAGEREIRVALGLYTLLCVAWFAISPILGVAVPRYVFPVDAPHVAALRWILLLSIAEFALGIPASVMQTACVARQQFESYARYNLSSGLLRNAAIVAAALVFRSPEAIAAVLAGRKVLEFAMAGRLLGWLPRAACRPVFHWASFGKMLRQSATLSVSQVLYSTAMSIGSPLVNAFFGLEGLGIYRAAFDLSGKIAFVSNGVTLVVFPGAARRFAAKPPAVAGSLYSEVLRSSATAYACFAAVAAMAAPYLLPAIGLTSTEAIRLFAILILALSLNAHALLSNELIQASGRYGWSVWFSAATLGALVVLFLLTVRSGIIAIGWAWLGAALVSACVADGLLLLACDAGVARQLAVATVKLAAMMAALGLALRQLGLASDAVAAVCGLVLVVLVSLAVRGAIPLVRSWRQGAAVPAG